MAGRKIEPLAGLEVEPRADCAGDRDGGGRTQRLLHGPERLPLIGGLGEDHTGGIDAEAVEPMTVEPA
jgi:hypothetical protein